MNSTLYILFAVLLCAAVTFALRVAPFALFGGKRGLPPLLRKLALGMPAAIIAVLVVYCLKGVPSQDAKSMLVTLGSVAAVVLLHLWRRNTLISIAGGTLLYMLLLRVVHCVT